MAHRKRKKSKRNVRCTICTTYRWRGNGKDRFKIKDRKQKNSEAAMVLAWAGER